MTFPRISYPFSRRDPVTDSYHGVTVADPYRWLEDPDAPDTIAWTDAQNALTRQLLDGPPRDALEHELRRLYDYPRTSAPVARAGRLFFTRNSGLQNQPVLYVRDRRVDRVLVDPNLLQADGTSALTAFEPSADGRFVAYALSSAGSDWQVIRVREVESGADLPDRLEWTRFVTLSWLGDGSGFYYTRFPDGGGYHPFVCLHRLGSAQATDRAVFAPSSDPEIVFEVDQSSDHRFLVVTAFKGASENSAINVFEQLPDGGAGALRWAVAGFDHAWHFIDAVHPRTPSSGGQAGSELLLRTNLDAPRGRIVGIQTDGSIRTVVAESSDSLVEATMVGERVAALYLRNASSRVRVFSIAGDLDADLALPGIGSVSEMCGDRQSDDLFLRFASFTHPPAVLAARASDASMSEFGTRATLPDCDRYEVTQVWYSSRDGTRVSMFVVAPHGLVRDGSAPVWLTAYGGFNINVVPDFDPAHFVWLARGGIVAVPNLRGGGEYGEAWHEAGVRHRKQNVFDDCIAAAEWLIAERFTRPGRIVFEGGSNGGLLVSAVLTQRPDLPGAVVCRVPVADMLRYHLFTIGRLWIPEYGCADDPDDFPILYGYSPLHRVRDEVAYPPVLITTAETDDRVDPGMARKLAARLQAAGGGPALIRIERRAGHGAGKPIVKVIAEEADIYAFALNALGIGS